MGELREFEASADAVGAVRGYVRDQLLHFGCADEAIDAAVLCASELATNAFVHADSPIGVVVDLGSTIRVTVRDRSTRPPVLRHPDVDDDGGRGLLLVSMFADSWGAQDDDEGKDVWFELVLRDRQSAHAGAGQRRRSFDTA